LSYAVDPTKLQSDLDLTPAEGFVLSRVDGATSTGEIAKLSPLGEEETLRCVYALVTAGILEVRGATKPALPNAPAQEPEPSPSALRFLEDMREKQRASVGSTLYELLEVEPTAAPEAIKTAYFQLAKRLHPDHRSGLKLDDADGVVDDLYLRVKDAYGSSRARPREALRFRALAEKERTRAPRRRLRPTRAQRKPAPESADTKKTFPSNQTARIHFGNGERFFANGRYHEAIEELGQPFAWTLRGPSIIGRSGALCRRTRSGGSRRRTPSRRRSSSIDSTPTPTWAWASSITRVGSETRARKMFEEALALDPDNVHALERLASGRPKSSTFRKLRGQ
jgi:hypothetical protein